MMRSQIKQRLHHRVNPNCPPLINKASQEFNALSPEPTPEANLGTASNIKITFSTDAVN